MFTGIVRELGTVKKITPKQEATTWLLEATFAEELKLGASVMVHGVCLTVIEFDAKTFTVDIVPETLECTMLGQIKEGDQVHLEPALKLQDAVDGHFVLGHVDTVIELKQVNHRDEYELELELPDDYKPFIVRKGSVALNGVSLTVADTDNNRFTVALIPETLKRTTFASLQVGAKINLEIDMVARYLQKMANFRA